MTTFAILFFCLLWCLVLLAFVVTCCIVRESGVLERVRVWARSKLVEGLSTCPHDGLRRDFQARFQKIEYRAPFGHSHQVAAERRTSAAMMCRAFVNDVGRVPYFVSTSARDQDADCHHAYHFAKDLVYPVRHVPIRDDHILVGVDVDYYLDVPSWLHRGVPLLVYTMEPRSVGGVVADGAYTIVGDRLHLRVNGGGSYEHGLWDYDADWLRVDYLTGSWFCSVERKHVDQDHVVVLINPVRWVWTPLARLLSGKPLRRRRFSVGGGVNRLDRMEKGELVVSVGLEGHFDSVNLPLRALNALQIRLSTAKTPEIHTVERYLAGTGSESAVYDAPLLYQILLKATLQSRVPYMGGGRPSNYQCMGPVREGYLASEEGRCVGRMLCAPLTDNPAVVPRESRNNDHRCVDGRIKAVVNNKNPPNVYHTYASEFVDRLVGSFRSKGMPWTVGEVYDAQSKPSQRLRSDRVLPYVTTRVEPVKVLAFMKKEAYSGVNDPRNISQVPTDHTLRLSAFTYAFKEQVLKQQPWYAPGKSPPEVARRLMEVAFGAPKLVASDYSRFDGTFSEWLRKYVERAMYVRWASMEFKSEVGALISAEYGAHGKTKEGVLYDAGFSRLSGSPLTTDGNSAGNAFVAYCAGRLSGLSPDNAYTQLGIYAGDDGVSRVEPAYMERAASALGLTLKCDTRRIGESVPFLGRVFVDPWTQEGSVQDPVRTIKKLHISFAPQDVSLDEALYNRASGYLELDPEAPIVSAWCRKVLTELGSDVAERAAASLVRCAADRPYHSGWPQATREIALLRVAESLGADVATVLEIEDRIARAGSYRDLANIVATPDQDKRIAARSDSSDSLEIPIRKRKRTHRKPVARTDSGVSTDRP